MSQDKSIVVVGGGVIGLCTAYYGMQRGHRVTVLERGGPDHDCCSLGNAGLVVPSHLVPLAAPGMVRMGLRMMLNADSPFYIRPRMSWDFVRWCWRFYRASNAPHVERSAPLLCQLSLASRQCFEELAEESGNEFGLVKRGSLMLCKSEHALQEEAKLAERARRLGLDAEVLTAEEAARVNGGMRMDVAGGVYFAQDCHLSPNRLIAWLTQRLAQGGVQFSWSSEVTGWRVGQDRVEAVETSRGPFTADEYVVCGGAWSPVLVRQLGLRLPLEAGKGYSVTLPSPRCLPAVGSILTEARVAVTPMGSSLRFAGTMELSGLDSSINSARVQAIVRAVPRYFPDFGPDDFRDVQPWAGLRPCSPDGLPYVGRVGRYTNFSVAAGHAMLGVSLGPVTGKLMADILSDARPSIDIAALNPNRYLGRA